MPVYPVAAGTATACASPGCSCRDRRPYHPSDLADEQLAVLEPRAREVMARLTVAVGRPPDGPRPAGSVRRGVLHGQERHPLAGVARRLDSDYTGKPIGLPDQEVFRGFTAYRNSGGSVCVSRLAKARNREWDKWDLPWRGATAEHAPGRMK
jgi:hypothetical protein